MINRKLVVGKDLGLKKETVLESVILKFLSRVYGRKLQKICLVIINISVNFWKEKQCENISMKMTEKVC